MSSLTLDLHTHLLEKDVKPHVYWRAVKKRGLDAVAITEHIEETPGLAYALLAEKKPSNVLLLPGMELNTNIGHVVAIGASPEIYSIGKFLQKGLDIKKAIKLAESNDVLLSIAHPWGFGHDSAAHIMGEARLQKLVENNCIGVEAFNGMIGSVGNFVYATNWVKRPLNFFDFLEKNRIARKTRLDRIGTRLKKQLDERSRDVLERCAKPIELGKDACFITAGSDAHYSRRIGTGVLKLKSRSKKLDNKKAIKAIKEKERVVWAGPFVSELPNGKYRVETATPDRKEIIEGLKYATISKGRAKIGSIGSKIKNRIKRKGSN